MDNKRVTLRALRTMAEENVDLIEALLAETARAYGEAVASFDRKDFRRLACALEVDWGEP